MRNENDSMVLERLGYCGEDVLEILGFRTCFKVRSGYDIDEESAAILHKKFNGDWQAASLWYGVVDRYYKK